MHSQEKYTHLPVCKINENIHRNMCTMPVEYTQISVYNAITRSRKTDLHKKHISKGGTQYVYYKKRAWIKGKRVEKS